MKKTPVSPEWLIKLLCSLAQEENISIGKTKLVKLLYLLEVEFYRLHRTRLTDAKWVFLHYGPYPLGLEALLDSPDVEVIPKQLERGRVFDQVKVSDRVGKESDLEPDIIRLAQNVFKKWGGLNLESLLDYVYFETEPMMNAKRGQELDFNTIKPPEPVRKIVLDQKKLAQIRKRLNEHLKELRLSKPGWDWNPLITEAIKIWDEGMQKLPEAGEAEIFPSEE